MGQVRLSLVSRSLRHANGVRCVKSGETWYMGAPEVIIFALEGDYSSVLQRVNGMPMTATVCCWLRGLQLPSVRFADSSLGEGSREERAGSPLRGELSPKATEGSS